MRIVRFSRPDQSVGWGLSLAAGIQDLSIADPTLPTSTNDLIANWANWKSHVERLSETTAPSSQSLTLLCPLSLPKKILCIGLNYRDHAIETKSPIPKEPIVFCKMPTAMIGPNEPILLPKVSMQIDYEAEMVLIIGKNLKNADEQQSLDGIFGYAVGHDVSARDWQKDKPGKQWFLGKSFDSFAPFGPEIVTADSVLDPNHLAIRCSVNGETLQDSNTSELIFKPVELVSYISQVMTLQPGDVIYTGTPAGVGVAREPNRFLKDGDIVEIEIESLGILRNPCIQER
jgi:2-keto-4-pentenoate hydratase/2-oxohepta-3-ene-1,7-dioic acid hydratase in catechol pathway